MSLKPRGVYRDGAHRRVSGVTYVCRAVKQQVGDGAPRRRVYLSALALGVRAQAPHQALRLAQARAQLGAGLGRAAVGRAHARGARRGGRHLQ